jgi:hypothetical protein
MAPTNADRLIDLAEKLDLILRHLNVTDVDQDEIQSMDTANGWNALPFANVGSDGVHVVAQVTEETTEVDGSDALSLSKLMGLMCRLRSDLSNFTNWESSLLNALDLIDVDADKMKQMLEGKKRPSAKLNKIIRTMIHSSIDRDDKVLNSKIRPFLREDRQQYKLNSGIAMLQTIRKYYYSQLENREDMLLKRLREFRFDGRNIVKYNSAYLDVYTELKDMNCVSGTKKDIKEYLDSLGSSTWTYDVRKAYEQLPEGKRTLEGIMELAVQLFIIKYPQGGHRNNDVQGPRNAFRAQAVTSRKDKVSNCPFCTKNHPKGRCPAYGKECSYCGNKNHFKKACRKLKTDIKNGPKSGDKAQGNINRIVQMDDRTTAVNDREHTAQGDAIDLWAMMAMEVEPVEDHPTFLIDSGASASLTGNKDLLENYKEGETMYFATAGKERLRVQGWGSLNLQTSLGILRIRCGYSPMLLHSLTLIGIRDLLEQGVTTHFGKGPEDSYIERRDKRHYLKRHNDCFILNIAQENMQSYTSHEVIDTHEKWMNWHRRLGHASPSKMKQTLGELIKVPKDLMVCRNCLEANAFVRSFVTHKATIEQQGTMSFKLEPDVMYMDYKVLKEGFILHILFEGWLELYYLVDKREAKPKILDHLSYLKQKPKKIVADDDTPFNDKDFAKLLSNLQTPIQLIPVQLVPPLHHQLNCVEPRIRYSMEKIRAIILDINILEEDREDFLELIVGYVSFVINRIGASPTPFERRYGKKPDVELMKPFFSKCVIPKLKRPNSLEPKGMVVHFVGYERNALAPTCLLWNPDTGAISRRAFIDCQWLLSPLDQDPKWVITDLDVGILDPLDDSDSESETSNKAIAASEEAPIESSQSTTPVNAEPQKRFREWKHMRDADLDKYGSNLENGLRRSKRLMINAVLTLDEIHYGHDLKRASDEVRRKYMLPIEAEVKNLHKHKVLQEIDGSETYIKKNFRVLNSQFILTQKRDGRLKARWVVCGNQQEGLSDLSTYAPTINRSLILLLLKLSLKFDLNIKTLDVSSAYLHGKLPVNEQVYIRSPYPLPPKIYKVVGNLYGLRQAGKVWNSIFTQDLEQFGLKASKLDPCLFFRMTPSPMFLLLHVDDGLILAKPDAAKDIINYLGTKYEITVDNGQDFLGLNLSRPGNGITIQQTAYINKILTKYGFLDAKPVETPMVAHATLEPAHPNEIINDIAEFQSLLGSLSFCRLTRPDLLFVMHELASVASAPGNDALETVKRTFRYLKGSSNLKIRITSSDTDEWACYVDASYGAGPNRKSIGGHVIFFGQTPILTNCTTIKHAVDSSAHAEAYALHAALKDVLFLKNVLHELELPIPKIRIYTDSKALLDFSFKSGSGKRSRHWDIVLHFMKHYIGSDKDMEVSFINGEDNVADMFTKALGKDLFLKHRATLLSEA